MQSNIDADSKAVSEFLEALMHVHGQLHDLAFQLRLYPEVKGVTAYPFVPGDMTQHHWDESRQRKAIGSEFGVSAELRSGAVMDWWLAFRCEENDWYIAATVFKSDKDEDGSHKIAEIEEQHTSTFEAFLQCLSLSTAWLTASEQLSLVNRSLNEAERK